MPCTRLQRSQGPLTLLTSTLPQYLPPPSTSLKSTPQTTITMLPTTQSHDSPKNVLHLSPPQLPLLRDPHRPSPKIIRRKSAKPQSSTLLVILYPSHILLPKVKILRRLRHSTVRRHRYHLVHPHTHKCRTGDAHRRDRWLGRRSGARGRCSRARRRRGGFLAWWWGWGDGGRWWGVGVKGR